MQRVLKGIFLVVLVIIGVKIFNSPPLANTLFLTGLALEEREGSLTGSIILNHVLKINGVIIKYKCGEVIIELPKTPYENTSPSLVFTRPGIEEEITRCIINKAIKNMKEGEIHFNVSELFLLRKGREKRMCCRLAFNDSLEMRCDILDNGGFLEVLWPKMRISNGSLDVVEILDDGIKQEIEEEVVQKCRSFLSEEVL